MNPYVSFILGFITGSVVTFGLLIRDHCKRNKQSKKEKQTQDIQSEALIEKQYADAMTGIKEMNDIIDEYVEDEYDESAHFVISPDEYGNAGLDMIGLTMYKNGVIVYNYSGEIVQDIEYKIGSNNLLRMGEFIENFLFVRDMENFVDYEIEFKDEFYNIEKEDDP